MFIVSRPIRCEMKPQKMTGKPQQGTVTTWYETTSWPYFFYKKYSIFPLDLSGKAIFWPQTNTSHLIPSVQKPNYRIDLKVSANRPRSIYQYSNMAPRLSGQTSIFGVVFFVSRSLLGIGGQRKLEKFAILPRKPWSHARILIYRTWAIVKVYNDTDRRRRRRFKVPLFHTIYTSGTYQ